MRSCTWFTISPAGDINPYLDASVSPCSEKVLVVNLKAPNPCGWAKNAVFQGGSYEKESLSLVLTA